MNEVKKIALLIAIIIVVVLVYSVESGQITLIKTRKTAGEGYTPQPPTTEQKAGDSTQSRTTDYDNVEMYDLQVFKIKTAILNGKEVDYSYIVLETPMPIKIKEDEVGVVFNGQEEKVLGIKELERNGTHYYVIYFEVHNVKKNSTVEVFWKDKHFSLTAPTVVEREESEGGGGQVDYDELIFDKLLPNEDTDNQNLYDKTLANVKGKQKGAVSALNSYVLSTEKDAFPVIAYAIFTQEKVLFDSSSFEDKLEDSFDCKVLRAEGFKITAQHAYRDQLPTNINQLTVERVTCAEDNQFKVYVKFTVNDKSFEKEFTVKTIYTLYSKTLTVQDDKLYVLIGNKLYLIIADGDIKGVQFTKKTGLLRAFLFKDSQGRPIIVWTDGRYTYYFKYSQDLSKPLVRKVFPARLIRAGWTVWNGLLNFSERFRIYVITRDYDGFKTLIINQENNKIETGWYGASIPVTVPESYHDKNDGTISAIRTMKLSTIKTDNAYFIITPVQTSQLDSDIFVILIKSDLTSILIRGAGDSVDGASRSIKEDVENLGVNIFSLFDYQTGFNEQQLEKLNSVFKQLSTQ